jgi:hypothetical protein
LERLVPLSHCPFGAVHARFDSVGPSWHGRSGACGSVTQHPHEDRDAADT